MTGEDAASLLGADIAAWVESQFEGPREGPARVPDFWDEHATTERLSAYLAGLGYRRPASPSDPVPEAPAT